MRLSFYFITYPSAYYMLLSFENEQSNAKWCDKMISAFKLSEQANERVRCQRMYDGKSVGVRMKRKSENEAYKRVWDMDWEEHWDMDGKMNIGVKLKRK